MGSDTEKQPVLPEVVSQDTRGKSRKLDCFAGGSRVLNVVTIICALLCLVAHCMAIAVGPKIRDTAGLLQQALRVYGIGFALIIIFTETEWERFLVSVRILDGCLPRGLLQLFEAVLTLELSGSTAQGETDLHKSLRLYRLLAGISLVACSGLYILGGVLCCGRNRAQARYQRAIERQRVLDDLEQLDQKRDELKGLLSVYSNQ